ncbi:hypothetical protein P0082_01585 [Candidatus Haliotispira prima]|uniref:NADH:ubiquinone oxidoreductase-like 20kDa subunit domain-containing protein n=1 Tax=Candidatus Haliotispira prima TaxID=3034016 RepID=A0ABY8MK59_9SPIO|nr:hypothetical protein P0082_01585 [Candidatus Haliotispira prima]
MSGHHANQANVIFSHDLPKTALDDETLKLREDKIKVAMIGLCGCWGCTLSFLDMDERLLTLLEKVTITRSSITDVKLIPERCTIGFVEGGVANDHDIEVLEHYRENCDILISVGACAVWGGVPAMRNQVSLTECLDEAYVSSVTRPKDQKPVIPHIEVPSITTKVYPAHEVVKMDYFIPGCPPDGDAIFKVLDDLVNGREVDLPTSMNRYD